MIRPFMCLIPLQSPMSVRVKHLFILTCLRVLCGDSCLDRFGVFKPLKVYPRLGEAGEETDHFYWKLKVPAGEKKREASPLAASVPVELEEAEKPPTPQRWLKAVGPEPNPQVAQL